MLTEACRCVIAEDPSSLIWTGSHVSGHGKDRLLRLDALGLIIADTRNYIYAMQKRDHRLTVPPMGSEI